MKTGSCTSHVMESTYVQVCYGQMCDLSIHHLLLLLSEHRADVKFFHFVLPFANLFTSLQVFPFSPIYKSNNSNGRAVNAYTALCRSNTKIADSSPVRG
jgi:hypothetical protein